MILGIDFDNTLVCYDGLFYAEARRRGWVPADAPRHKQGVRDYLRAQGRDADFTLLQGRVYGPGMTEAPAYPGALEAVKSLKSAGAQIFVISHKTRESISGPQYDLHQAARRWLDERGFFSPGFLRRDEVFFEETKEAKMARIAALHCGHFIDDLPELLGHPLFPVGTEPILFAPPAEDGSLHGGTAFRTFANWSALCSYLMENNEFS